MNRDGFFWLIMWLLTGQVGGDWRPVSPDSGGVGVQGDRRPGVGARVVRVWLCFGGRRPAWAARVEG
jgi:hypothetical protein